jgi:type II secretory pathway component GspD/PulD (secretin)
MKRPLPALAPLARSIRPDTLAKTHALLAAVCVATISACGIAQTPQTPTPVTTQPQPSGDQQSDEISLEYVTFDFAGGDFAQFVAQLRQVKIDKPLNIIVSPEARRFTVPAISVRRTAMRTLMNAAVMIAVDPDGLNRKIEYSTVFSMHGEQDGGEDIIMLSAPTPAAVGAFGTTQRLTQVFSVADLVEGNVLTPVDLSRTLEAVFAKTGGEVSISFHPESKLIIVSGVRQELETAKSAIDELRVGFMEKIKANQRRADAEAQLQVISDKQASLDKEANDLRRRLQDVEGTSGEPQAVRELMLSLDSTSERRRRLAALADAAEVASKLAEEGITSPFAAELSGISNALASTMGAANDRVAINNLLAQNEALRRQNVELSDRLAELERLVGKAPAAATTAPANPSAPSPTPAKPAGK